MSQSNTALADQGHNRPVDKFMHGGIEVAVWVHGLNRSSLDVTPRPPGKAGRIRIADVHSRKHPSGNGSCGSHGNGLDLDGITQPTHLAGQFRHSPLHRHRIQCQRAPLLCSELYRAVFSTPLWQCDAR
jgi:hypothetical protein